MTKEQIQNMTDEERYEYSCYVNERNYRLKKKIKRAICAMLFLPLSIVFRVVSVVCKIIGKIALIGLPFGIYFAIRLILQLSDGVKFSDTYYTEFTIVFLGVPIFALFCSSIADLMSEHLKQRV